MPACLTELTVATSSNVMYFTRSLCYCCNQNGWKCHNSTKQLIWDDKHAKNVTITLWISELNCVWLNHFRAIIKQRAKIKIQNKCTVASNQRRSNKWFSSKVEKMAKLVFQLLVLACAVYVATAAVAIALPNPSNFIFIFIFINIYFKVLN